MNHTFTCILLLLSLSATFGKYVYIEKRMTWHEAQEYCRLFHTDLAPVSNNHDTKRLRRLAGDVNYWMWIGLERDSTDSEKWMWSGGGSVSTFFWAQWEPTNWQNENYGAIHEYKWYASQPNHRGYFFCYNVVVVRERKTWEEALEHCREHHRDLASIASETEMLLIQKELGKNLTTEHVWTGLHFFPGSWLWVDRQPLDYEAWGQEGEPSCPEVSLECGALQVTGGTQNNSTGPTPVTGSAVGTGEVYADNTGNYGVNIEGIHGLNISEGRSAVADAKERVWEARDCEERLHFLCY